MRELRHETWALAALLALHLLLGVYWSVAIPIWEAHDEDGHYCFVRFLATEQRLPRPGDKCPVRNCQLHQPPLYYLLAALPVEQELVLRDNPHMVRPDAEGGHNRYVHDPAAESWPFRGTALAVRVARCVSVLLGALAVLFTYLAARTLAPGEPWVRWGAALTLAFWPQFRFATAVINNDLLVTVCGAALAWLMVRAARCPEPRLLLALCLAGGLAPLSKGNGLGLAAAALVGALTAVLGALRGQRLRMWLALLPGLALGVAAFAWWGARNLDLGVGVFGSTRTFDWVQRSLVQGLQGGRLGWGAVPAGLPSGLLSFWAAFGWSNLGLPLPLYWPAPVWVGLGLAGLPLSWPRSRPEKRQVVAVCMLLITALAASAPGVLHPVAGGWEHHAGRYLLPALPALAVLLGLGWSALLPRRARRWGWAGLGGALGVLALLTPVLYIRPAYAPPPPPLAEADLAAYAPLHVTLGDFAELAGYRLEEPFIDPAGTLHLELAFRTLARSDADYTLAVQAFAGKRELLGGVSRFPGRGALATSGWQPGELFAEELAIPIHSTAPEGRLAWIEVSFYDHADRSPAAVSGPQGEPLGASVRLSPVKVRGTAPALAAFPEESYRFGEAIHLLAAQAGARSAAGTHWLDVELVWAKGTGGNEGTGGDWGVRRWLSSLRPGRSPTAPRLIDYTVSIQLRDAAGAIVAQSDGWPRRGSYPTSLWEPGEVVADGHTLFLPADLPAGRYGLYACLYDLETLERLPVVDPGGRALPDAEVPLAMAIAGAGGAIELAAMGAVRDATADYAWAQATDTAVAGLVAADQDLALGRAGDALNALRRDTFPHEPHSLAARYRSALALELWAQEGSAQVWQRAHDRLRHFPLASAAVPADPRLALYLGQTMADLVDDGDWTRDTLLNIVAYQVWRFAEGPQTERLLQALAGHFPADPDLCFYRAELYHRRGEFERAAQAYGETLALDPAHTQAHLRLGLLAEAEGRLEEAAAWYARYHTLAPGDLLGLQRLAAVASALGRSDAGAWQEALAAVTDGRRLVAGLLGVAADDVAFGPNLVPNGDLEIWAGATPVGWEWSAMYSRGVFNAAAFARGAEHFLPIQGLYAARVDGFWLHQKAGRHPARAGFWQRTSRGQGRILLAPGSAYLVSFSYRTAGLPDGKATIWVTGEPDVLWQHDRCLPATGGEWRRFLAVGWNLSGGEAPVQPLLRSFGLGSVQFDDLQIRQIHPGAGAGVEPGKPQFLIIGAG
jgi:tetratricopeptide (TPR) repeat protein